VIASPSSGTEFELFPMTLWIFTCDASGKVDQNRGKDYLFSKSATIADVIQELCEKRELPLSSVRLWNYAYPTWRDQYILPPEQTLWEAKLQDGERKSLFGDFDFCCMVCASLLVLS
jgi:hypothetical protein